MKRQKHTVLVLTLCLVCVPATSLQQDKNFEGDISIWADPDDPIGKLALSTINMLQEDHRQAASIQIVCR